MANVVQDLVAATTAKIEVDVGWVRAPGVEEAFEEQVVGDGVHGGDAQAVGDEGIGHAPPCADRNLLAARMADDIGHCQEQGGIPMLRNGCVFSVQTASYLWGQGVPIPRLGSSPGLSAQHRVGCLALGEIDDGPLQSFVRQRRAAALSDL